jgi:membrane protein
LFHSFTSVRISPDAPRPGLVPGSRWRSLARFAWRAPPTVVTLAKESIAAWIDDYAPSMGAAPADYTLFSLAPVLLLAISVAGLVFGAEAARGEIVGQLRGLIGQEGAIAV